MDDPPTSDGFEHDIMSWVILAAGIVGIILIVIYYVFGAI